MSRRAVSVAEVAFADVGAMLRWYFARQERLQSPRAVRWGRSGSGVDVAEVLATVTSIGAALERLAAWSPEAHAVLVLRVREGLSQRAVAKQLGCSQATVAARLGKAEAFVAGGWC